MKLDNEALLEIVALLLEGLTTGTDISEKLRELDLEMTDAGKDGKSLLTLSQDYKLLHPRAGDWKDDGGDTGEGEE